MDREITIFLNIARYSRFEGWTSSMEMHHIYSIIRNPAENETFLLRKEQNMICVPMEAEDHEKFLQSVFTSKEIWFPYVGYIYVEPEEERHNSSMERENEFLTEELLKENKQKTFSVITEKN